MSACMRDYVKALGRKGVSPVITLYAIRDVKGKEEQEVLEIKQVGKRERAG